MLAEKGRRVRDRTGGMVHRSSTTSRMSVFLCPAGVYYTTKAIARQQVSSGPARVGLRTARREEPVPTLPGRALSGTSRSSGRPAQRAGRAGGDVVRSWGSVGAHGEGMGGGGRRPRAENRAEESILALRHLIFFFRDN